MESGRWKDYGLLILFLIIVWGFTFRYYGDANVVSHIGLASTLISIVLSIIAILYTLYQNIAAASHADRLTGASLKLSDSANHISETVQGLQDIRVQVEALTQSSSNLSAKAEQVGKAAAAVQGVTDQVTALHTITSVLTDSTTRIGEVVTDMETLKGQIAQLIESAVRNEIATVREDIGSLTKQLSTSSGAQKPDHGASDLNRRVVEASHSGLSGLYLIEQARIHKSTLSLHDIVSKVPKLNEDYMFGFLIAFAGGTPYQPTRRRPNFIDKLGFDEGLGKLITQQMDSRFNLKVKFITELKPLIDAIDWSITESPSETSAPEE